MAQVLFSFVMGLGILLGSLPARPDDFTIELEVKSSTGTKVTHAERVTPDTKAKSRVVVEARPGEALTVTWTLTNVSAQEFADVLVHCFVVPEKAPGQTEVPKLDQNVTFESALTMDFKPRDKASGQMNLKVMKPGYYLLRVETLGGERQDKPEYFAAMDIAVR